MKRKMLVIVTVLLLSMALIVTGCGSKSTGGSKTGDGGSKQKFTVGLDAAYAPFEYMNEKGEIVGFSVDLLNALAEVGNFEIVTKDTGWDPLFQGAIDNGEVDFGISSITITEDRKQEFDFSDPYFVAHQLILVPKGSTITKFQDLEDKKVGVQNGTTGHEVVKGLLGETNSNIRAFESTPFAIQDMLNGNVDAVVADDFVVLEFIKQNPDKQFTSIEDPFFEPEYYGMMFKKGDTEKIKVINDALKKVKESGKLKEIFGQDLK